eukprot:Sspe_Gene.104550::Locus_81013_Transcript_1_1_Confidence_1.000_Length_876::g.104550::m.104550
MRPSYLVLLLLPGVVTGRCDVDYVEGTMCGGHGRCHHAVGEGRHWLRDARCVCHAGFCNSVAGEVVGSDGSGPADVHTCTACRGVSLLWESGVDIHRAFSPVGGGWSVYTPSQCRSFGAVGAAPGAVMVQSSFLRSPPFDIGPDTVAEVTFHGGGADGGGQGLTGRAEVRGTTSRRGFQGAAVQIAGHWRAWTRGGGHYEKVVRRMALGHFAGQVATLDLVNTFHGTPFGWVCVSRVAVYNTATNATAGGSLQS